MIRPPAAAVACMALCAVLASTTTRAADMPAVPLPFSDFFKRPIGPRGLEPTARLLALSGDRVHVRGFVVHGADADERVVIVAPVPVTLGDEDESLADDLPAAIAYLHGQPELVAALRQCKGAVEAIGVLETGARREGDNRFSMVRLDVQSVRCAR